MLTNQHTGGAVSGAYGQAGAGLTLGPTPPVMQSMTAVIHDEIDRINSAVADIEGALHGGVVAQFPPQPASNGKPDRAPCVRGAVEAAVERLRTIRVRLEAVAEANRAL